MPFAYQRIRTIIYSPLIKNTVTQSEIILTMFVRTVCRRFSNISKSRWNHSSAVRFHFAILPESCATHDLIVKLEEALPPAGCRNGPRGRSSGRRCSPARNVFHPREEFDPMGSRQRGQGDTYDVIVDPLDALLLQGMDHGRVIDRGHDHRRREPPHVFIPPFWAFEYPTGQEDGFGQLCVIEHLGRRFV